MKRHFQILLSGALALIAIQSSQAVISLTANDGSWTRLRWTVADSSLAFAGPPNATRVSDDNDLFNFAVPSGSRGIVDVTDIRDGGDGYSVLDFNAGLSVLGSTTIGDPMLSSIEEDPDNTFASADWGSGSIPILTSGAGGTAAFKIQHVGSATTDNQGAVFVRVRTEVIPEPSSSMLALLGLVGLAARRRRA